MNTIKPLSCKFCHQPCDISILDDIFRSTITTMIPLEGHSWKCTRHENKVYYYTQILHDGYNCITEFRCYHNEQLYTINIHKSMASCRFFKISFPKFISKDFFMTNIIAEQILELEFLPKFTPENVATKLKTYLPFL